MTAGRAPILAALSLAATLGGGGAACAQLSGSVALPVYTGTTSMSPVVLSTRITNGSTRFRGIRSISARALATAQLQPPAATHHAARRLR